MVIRICSLAAAQEAAEKAEGRLSVISITSDGDRDVVFRNRGNFDSILHLKFNDLQSEFDEEGIPYGRPIPGQKDFDGLKKFVDGLHCELLIVHCREGISRSAAVAAAIFEYRNRTDTLRTGQAFEPNRLVYELSCCELGIRPGNLSYKPSADRRDA